MLGRGRGALCPSPGSPTCRCVGSMSRGDSCDTKAPAPPLAPRLQKPGGPFLATCTGAVHPQPCAPHCPMTAVTNPIIEAPWAPRAGPGAAPSWASTTRCDWHGKEAGGSGWVCLLHGVALTPASLARAWGNLQEHLARRLASMATLAEPSPPTRLPVVVFP